MSRAPAFMLLEQLDMFTRPEPPVPVVPPEKSRSRHEPRGKVYDMEEYFNIINRVVFKNVLEPSVLRWSRNRWSYTLGICETKRRVITLNRSLDDARVPDVVIASIMHHEMLHLHFGISEGPDGRRRVHTPQFRAAEKLFPGFVESEKWVNDNWPLRGRPATRPRATEQSFLRYLMLMYP
jgi:hypothetical protein